jgi:hypothetical protein
MGGVVLLSLTIAVVLTMMDDGLYAGITIAFGLAFGAAASVVAAVMVLYADRHHR